MNNRELWQSIMHYGEFDRMPVFHWRGWPETTERWEKEGLPPGVTEHEYFGATRMWNAVSANLEPLPAFEEEVLEDTPEYRIFRGADGVVQQDWKNRSCIPHFIDFTLKSARDWDDYKKRLQPDPARIPANLEEQIHEVDESGTTVIVMVASMMGWIRNWMGVENMSYLMYDDADCYADMVDTLAELACWSLDRILPKMREMDVVPDMGFGWEDICGKSGPLVSPDIFDRCVAPGYQKMRAKLGEHGVPLLGIDSDGWVEPLLPNWFEAGVNVMFPLQPGSWDTTPAGVRQRFGRELRIMGGYDKLALEKGPAAIDAELERHMDVMREGGFVLMPDHLITPDTPLANCKYYIDRIRELRL